MKDSNDSNKSGVAQSYLHGFTKEEQDRLFAQARVHEGQLFPHVDFSGRKKIVEIGSGVGAQTKILRERFPSAAIHCVDASEAQVNRAREALAADISQGKVAVTHGDALHLPFGGQSFDGAFLCWLLEHVTDPVGILKEARRVLQPGGVIYCNEVFNTSFYGFPGGEHNSRYWAEFNRQQVAIGGDPDIGPKLGNYLAQAGFKNVTLQFLNHHYDDREPAKRKAFAAYWKHLLESAAPGLLQSGRINQETVTGMKTELDHLGSAKGAIIFINFVLARAHA